MSRTVRILCHFSESPIIYGGALAKDAHDTLVGVTNLRHCNTTITEVARCSRRGVDDIALPLATVPSIRVHSSALRRSDGQGTIIRRHKVSNETTILTSVLMNHVDGYLSRRRNVFVASTARTTGDKEDAEVKTRLLHASSAQCSSGLLASLTNM